MSFLTPTFLPHHPHDVMLLLISCAQQHTQQYFHCCYQLAHSNGTFFYFKITTSGQEVIFLFYNIITQPHELSDPIVHGIRPYPFLLSSFSQCEDPDDNTSCVSSHAIPTFSFFFFHGLRFPFILHTLFYRGVSNCNPILDSMYPCIDYSDGECYD